MTMNPQQLRAWRVACRLREDFRARPEGFTQCEYRRVLHERLAEFRDAAYDGFVDHYAELTDRDSARPRTPDTSGARQLELFDLLGEYRLGDGRRIARRLAMRSHARESLLIEKQNVKAVIVAYRASLDEYRRLCHYWGLGVTKQEAVAAYRQAHPDGHAPQE